MTIEIYLLFHQILIELEDGNQLNFKIIKGEKIIYFIINTQDTNLYI